VQWFFLQILWYFIELYDRVLQYPPLQYGAYVFKSHCRFLHFRRLTPIESTARDEFTWKRLRSLCASRPRTVTAGTPWPSVLTDSPLTLTRLARPSPALPVFHQHVLPTLSTSRGWVLKKYSSFRGARKVHWRINGFLQLTPRLSNDFTTAWLTFTFPQLFAVAATLKSIDYNVAMTFILNNNNNNNNNNGRAVVAMATQSKKNFLSIAGLD